MVLANFNQQALDMFHCHVLCARKAGGIIISSSTLTLWGAAGPPQVPPPSGIAKNMDMGRRAACQGVG